MAVFPLAAPQVLCPVGLETADARASHWKAFERVRIEWYTAVTRSCARQFLIERDTLVPILRNASTPGTGMVLVEQAINRREHAWDAWLRDRYELVGPDFSRRIYAGFEKAWGPVQTWNDVPLGIRRKAGDELIDVWLQTIRAWLGESAGLKIRLISATTRRLLMDELGRGVALGEGIPKLARRLSDVYEGFSLDRAVTIARTEVIAASNLGGRAGALSTGLPLEKYWIATADTRTRVHHDSVNEQTTPMHEPYLVNGERLMFPGDGSLGATASNLVLCRCTEGYRQIARAA